MVQLENKLAWLMFTYGARNDRLWRRSKAAIDDLMFRLQSHDISDAPKAKALTTALVDFIDLYESCYNRFEGGSWVYNKSMNLGG